MVSAKCTMFKITSGTLTVKSGNYTTTSGNVIEVSGSATDSTTSSGGGSSSGDGFITLPGTTIATTTKGTANIDGGSFTSKDGNALYVTSVSAKDTLIAGAVVQGTANITGGSFAGISLVATTFSSQALKSGYVFYTADASGEYTVLTAANTDVKDRAVEIKLCTHIYTNADGVCDACGNESGFKFSGYTLTLDGTIGMNFYTRFSDEFASSNNALIRFTIGGETIEFKPSQAKDGTHEGESYKVFTVPV